MSYHTVQVYLYKIALDNRLIPTTSTSAAGPFPPAVSHLRRAELLLCCLSAINSVTEYFLSLSDASILALPYPGWMQLRHSVFVLWHLVAAVNHSWDPAYPSNLLNYSELLERLADRLDGVSSSCAGAASSSVRRLPKLSEKFVQKLRETASAERNSSGSIDNGELVPGCRDGVGDILFEGEINDAMSEFWNPGGLL